MKIDQTYELFVQDLVMRLATLPDFKLSNGELERIFQTAFGVAEKFFPRWEVEKERLTETLAKAPDALGGGVPEAQADAQASARGNGKEVAIKWGRDASHFYAIEA
jgi:hypothetical protein